jgi:hypothetical protein
MPGNFHGMLVREDMDGLKSGSLDGVDKTIANHIDLDGVLSEFIRLPTEGYPQGGRFWVGMRRH